MDTITLFVVKLFLVLFFAAPILFIFYYFYVNRKWNKIDDKIGSIIQDEETRIGKPLSKEQKRKIIDEVLKN